MNDGHELDGDMRWSVKMLGRKAIPDHPHHYVVSTPPEGEQWGELPGTCRVCGAERIFTQTTAPVDHWSVVREQKLAAVRKAKH